MTTLLMPLASARSLLPPAILFGVAPHYYIGSTALRLFKCVLPENIYEQVDHWMYHSYQSLVTYFFETYTGSKVLFQLKYVSKRLQKHFCKRMRDSYSYQR